MSHDAASIRFRQAYPSFEAYRRVVVGHLISEKLDIATMPQEVRAQATIEAGYEYQVGAYDCALQVASNLQEWHQYTLCGGIKPRFGN
jgi:hypothetical protein